MYIAIYTFIVSQQWNKQISKRHFARANMNMHLCDSHPELVLIFLGEQHHGTQLKTSTTIKYSMPAEAFRFYSIISSANTSPSINHPCKLKSVWVLGTSRYQPQPYKHSPRHGSSAESLVQRSKASPQSPPHRGQRSASGAPGPSANRT